MAERRSSSSSRSSGSSSRKSGSSSNRKSSSNRNGSRSNSHSGLSGREAIDRVKQELPSLLGHPINSVLGLESDDDHDGWTVKVEVVELSRIPPTTDVLGSYAVTLDQDGELTGVRRERRYYRNQADSQ